MEIKKYIFIFILEIYIKSITCSNEKIIIFPLIKKDNSYLSNLKNITEIIQFFFSELTIAELELGIPKQKTNIIIRPDESNIYLSSAKHNLSVEDKTAEIVKLQYKNIKFFNNEKSQSIEYNGTFSKSYFYNNFKEWKIINDYFEINSKEKIKLNLILATSILYDDVGSLGLLPVKDISVNQFTQSFLHQLKINNIIDNYKWFIYYGEENKKDYLILGCSPHEFKIPDTGNYIFPKLDLEKDYHSTSDKIFVDSPRMLIYFDELFITSNITNLKKNNSFIANNTHAFLKINLGVIIGTTEYQNYLQSKYFSDYLNSNKCHNKTFKIRKDNVPQIFTFFYCEESLYNDIKKSFMPLVFKKVDLNKYFILSFNDLFLRKNEYLIFLVVFPQDYNFDWELGTPFLRKYQFVYDFENKLIGYYNDKYKKDDYNNDDDYENNNGDKKKNYWKYIGYITLIIILSSILISLGFYLGKKVYQIRKKRANELNDDYEYKENDNNIINDNFN